VVFSLSGIERQKELKKLQFGPESLRAMLEHKIIRLWPIEQNLIEDWNKLYCVPFF